MMQVFKVEAERIPHEWDWLGPLLAKAVKHDKERDLMDVFGLLVGGRMRAWIVQGQEAWGAIVTSIGNEVFWVNYAVGKVPGGVKAMRALIAEFETIAARQGCTEVRVQGRDWRRVLEPVGFGRTHNPHRNELRKVL